MTENMSFSNAPDEGLLGRVAGALAVDEAFAEKDWFVVQAIERLAGLATGDFTPVFSGGTSLLKAHGLIRRFSEDIDFKLSLSDGFLARSRNQHRHALKAFRDDMVAAWTAMGFDVTSCISRDEHRFIELEMTYPTILEPHGSLRPHILAQVSAKPPRLDVQHKPVGSFAGQYVRLAPEVRDIACSNPVETATDKLSAFSWRTLLRDRAHPSHRKSQRQTVTPYRNNAGRDGGCRAGPARPVGHPVVGICKAERRGHGIGDARAGDDRRWGGASPGCLRRLMGGPAIHRRKGDGGTLAYD